MLRGLFSAASSILPYKPLAFRVFGKRTSNIFAPFYHLVSPQTPIHIKHLYPVITPKQFGKDLDFMLRHFSPVEVRDM